jgi:hypothetical protein
MKGKLNMLDQANPDHLLCESDQYGKLEKAGAFVYQDFEPADEKSWAYVESLTLELELPTKSQNGKKYARCMSDFLMAARVTSTGKITWLMGSEHYYTMPYGRKVAQATLNALKTKGHLRLVQKSSKKDKLARLYAIDKVICPDWLRFRNHGEGPLVIVKSPKLRNKIGKVIGGARMGRKHFLPEIAHLEAQVSSINAKMLSEPLRACSGRQFVRCYRVFNNAALHTGGRLYGRWQGDPEKGRLSMTIAGEPVVEIDIKASFLSIASANFQTNSHLSADPYQMIDFVETSESDEALKRNRKAAKLLINSYFFKPGEPQKFPKGEKDKTTGKTMPFKQKYKLNKPVGNYMKQIHDAFPFLGKVKPDGMKLMYEESEIMIQAILTLLKQGVVSYPVHDCLIVKATDQEAGIEAIQEAMTSRLGFTPALDVSWLDEYAKVKSKIILDEKYPPQSNKSKTDPIDHTVIDDDSFDVIEDY